MLGCGSLYFCCRVVCCGLKRKADKPGCVRFRFDAIGSLSVRVCVCSGVGLCGGRATSLALTIILHRCRGFLMKRVSDLDSEMTT